MHMHSVRITREQAEQAIRDHAKDDKIAVLLVGGAGLRPGVFDVPVALVHISEGHLFAYQSGPFGYDLAVLAPGMGIIRFDVPMPQERDPETFLAQYGGVIADLLGRVQDPFAASLSRSLRVYGAREGWSERELTAADYGKAMDILTEHGTTLLGALERRNDWIGPAATKRERTAAQALRDFLGDDA